MVIQLKEDLEIKLRAVTITHPITEHLHSEVNKLVKKLLRDSIIEPVPKDEKSEWISPTFFVPKEGGRGGVRLVTQ